MLSPYIHAALPHERHQEFLARAETDRQGRGLGTELVAQLCQ